MIQYSKHLFSENSNNRKFSIVIPSWNNLPYLKTCIESIQKNSTFPHQIIVHVNDGNDGTIEYLENQKIDYTHSLQNIGICYALNAARCLVKTDYLLYMNDDMYVCPNWDKALDDEIKKIPHQLFFLSSTLIEPYESGNACVIAPFDFGRNLEDFKEKELLETYHLFPKVDWQGATWPPNILHIDTWDLIGGYSVEFSPGMYSDPDFSMKLWHAGVRLFKGVAASRVYHFGSKSTLRIKKNNGRKTFIKKWLMSPSTFNNFYLLRGKIYVGEVSNPEETFSFKMKRLTDWFKVIF